ncbi:type II secretion system protein N [Sphingomonas spermidinifaciens]|nr:type II secretion system protein N [Sphingomonas spermidinifaciens]
MQTLLRRGTIAETIARPADPAARLPGADGAARRRLILFGSIGIAAYAIAMLATMPASVFIKNRPWRTGVAGTIWSGEVGVAGGSIVRWTFAPLRSLTSLGFAVDWRASGEDTDLGGQAILRPGGVRLDAVSGSANGSLLSALLPNLGFACDLTMQAEFPRLTIGPGRGLVEGQATIDPGACRRTPDGAPVPTPAMILVAEHVGSESRIRLAPIAQRRRTLIDASVSEDGSYRVTLTPDGASMLPFTGLPAGVGVESSF